jgi:pyruvate dehydrogenase E1 component beta subunit
MSGGQFSVPLVVRMATGGGRQLAAQHSHSLEGCYGGSLGKSIEAAETLAKEGVEAEVIDLRVLRPLDTRTILTSVAKTHRAVIIDEAWRTGSFAAEISAQIMEGAFDELDAPVARVCGEEAPMPYAKHLEDAALPQAVKILKAAREMM